MPELPEVETAVRGLQKTVVGKTIGSVALFAPPKVILVSNSFVSGDFANLLKGRKILNISRRGKNILAGLSGDITLWIHLKMTGKFLFLPERSPIEKHDLLIFSFKGGLKNGSSRIRHHLRYNDYRRFGRLRLYTNAELWDQKGLKELGPEPLEIPSHIFVRRCRLRRRMIKPALLDQSFIAGLGNIYADEALFAARIHPRRLTSTISVGKLSELHAKIQQVLKKAITLKGTSVISYSDINGQPGSFQKYLKVYKCEGRPCPACGRSIVREKIGSRSAHYCPRCQRI